jgi:hypothetical protein
MAINKLPTFAEWLEENDPDMHEGWKNWATTAGVAAAGLGMYGLHLANQKPAEKPAMVASAQSSNELPQAPKIGPSAASPVDTPVKAVGPGKTFPMKGGRSGHADVRATIQRPNSNTWEFTIVGHMEPNSAIAQAKQIVQNELGAKTQSGLSADFDPTEDGMKVTIHFTPAHQRQRALEGN